MKMEHKMAWQACLTENNGQLYKMMDSMSNGCMLVGNQDPFTLERQPIQNQQQAESMRCTYQTVHTSKSKLAKHTPRWVIISIVETNQKELSQLISSFMTKTRSKMTVFRDVRKMRSALPIRTTHIMVAVNLKTAFFITGDA